MAGLDSFYPSNAIDPEERRPYSSLSTPGGRSPVRRREIHPFSSSEHVSFEGRQDENDGVLFPENNRVPSLHKVNKIKKT